MGLHGEKKKKIKFCCLIVFAWVLHPFCISPDGLLSRGERIRNAGTTALLPRHLSGSEGPGAAGWPFKPGDKRLTSVPFPSARQILGLKRHFNPDSLSTWSRNSAPIYFLYRQASVKTLPRFEGMFDTIVSSSSTFNCWSEKLLNLILHFLTCVICYSSFLQL